MDTLCSSRLTDAQIQYHQAHMAKSILTGQDGINFIRPCVNKIHSEAAAEEKTGNKNQ